MAKKSIQEAEQVKARRLSSEQNDKEYNLSVNLDRTMPPELLNSGRLSERGNATVRASMMQMAQQTYGNRADNVLVRTMGETQPDSQARPIAIDRSAAINVQRKPEKEQDKSSLEDRIVQMLMTALKQLDAEIGAREATMKHPGKSESTDSKSQSEKIDVEIVKLQKLIHKRNQLMNVLSGIMSKQNKSAQNVIRNIGR